MRMDEETTTGGGVYCFWKFKQKKASLPEHCD